MSQMDKSWTATAAAFGEWTTVATDLLCRPQAVLAAAHHLHDDSSQPRLAPAVPAACQQWWHGDQSGLLLKLTLQLLQRPRWSRPSWLHLTLQQVPVLRPHLRR
jgi:hypothetical protein